MDYPVSDGARSACSHVATIARHKFYGLDRFHIPSPDSDTATVTFIKIDRKVYAVTAYHVIEGFGDAATREGNPVEGYYLLQSPGLQLRGPFIRPQAEYPFAQPDVAICPIKDDDPARLEKEPFEVLPEDDAKWPVSHAVAVGFPTSEKHDRHEVSGQTRLELRCVHAIAEGLNSDGTNDQVQFHSELPNAPSIESLSGMSGGPIFWTNDTEYGLIGFVKEALDITPKAEAQSFYDTPKVHFLAQRVDYSTLLRWVKFVDENWPQEEKRLKELAEREQVRQNEARSPEWRQVIEAFTNLPKEG